jgi:hypothetical protein
MRPGTGRAVHDRRSADGRRVCAGVRPGSGNGPPGLQGLDLSTTEIYARASTEAKRRALEAVYQGIVTCDLPEWNQDPGLLDWLAGL